MRFVKKHLFIRNKSDITILVSVPVDNLLACLIYASGVPDSHHIEQSLQLLTSNLPQSSQLLVQIRQPWLRSVATVCRVATSCVHISSINKEINISMASSLLYVYMYKLSKHLDTQRLLLDTDIVHCKQF